MAQASEVDDLTYPVVVRDASMASATFVVPRAGVAALLPPGLEPVVVARRWALLAVVFVDYRDTDLGRYHEVGTCFVVRGPGSTKPGAYVHRLPVDQAFTMEAGRRLWGFPKWRTTSEVAIDGDEHVLTMASRGLTMPVPGAREITMDAWTWSDDVLRRTPWTMRHERARPRPGGTTIVLGERHVMATELRGLGLPKRAVLTTVVDRVTASFGEAEVVQVPGVHSVRHAAPARTSPAMAVGATGGEK